jgi:TonB family protein
MKKAIVLVLSALLVIAANIFSQNEMADNATADLSEKAELNDEVWISMNFIEKYEIDESAGKKVKIITSTQLKNSIGATSKEIKSITSGTIVEAYKYFPKEAAWAIKFNEEWGIVTATSVAPLNEKVVETNQQPYDEAPKMLSEIQIKYPAEAKKAGITGKIIIKVLISKTGLVLESEMVKSIPGLDEAAIEAIKKVRFKPGKFEGKPVEVWIRIPISFEIGNF